MEREHNDLLEPRRRDREQALLFPRGQPALDAIADLLLGIFSTGLSVTRSHSLIAQDWY